LIGETIEHYRILEIVGRGGMGIVYKALDVNLDRTVAVKVISTELREDPEFVERFRHEARVQAALNHPNIAMLFDFFIWKSSPVAVMEFIEGETLQSKLQRGGPIPAHIALPIFIQALRGVAAGHRRGIIHRDLKPANLMLTDESVVKITDFGIAKMQSSTGQTQVSTRVGSSSYMSPEQILGRPVDVRTDIYAMGVTLYEMLCGRPPFQAKTAFEIESAHVRDMPLPPITYNPQIPGEAVHAVMRALAKDPNERFATAEEFIHALPDLHGVPFVADETIVSRTQVPSPHADTGSLDEPTLLRTQAPTGPRVATPGPTRSSVPRAIIIAGTIGLVVLAAGASLRFMGRTTHVVASSQIMAKEEPAVGPDAGVKQTPAAAASNTGAPAVGADTGTKEAPPPQTSEPPVVADTPPAQPVQNGGSSETKLTQPATTGSETHRPATSDSHVASTKRDLSGVWTGVYADRTGNTQLKVVNLEIRQIANGDITGSLTYRTDASEGETCSLEKSKYSKEQKRLRLIVHCRNPGHPRYLNVPLDFGNVDPGSNSLRGGKLEFHLADDIIVSLTRTRSA
jgi:serine/threonine protein kinase